MFLVICSFPVFSSPRIVKITNTKPANNKGYLYLFQKKVALPSLDGQLKLSNALVLNRGAASYNFYFIDHWIYSII